MWLSLTHAIGLTNLSDDQVERFIRHKFGRERAVTLSWVGNASKWIVGLCSLFIERRAGRDQRKLLRVLPRFRNLVRALRLEYQARHTSQQPEVHLCVAALAAAQPIIDDYVGGALLSLQLLTPEAKSFTCVYPPVGLISPRFLKLVDELGQIDRDRSYGGLALRENRTIIESNLSRPNETVDLKPEHLQILMNHGIAGIAVQPVRVSLSPPNTNMPAAILNVDFHHKRGLIDNQATRDLLGILEEFFSFALQMTLANTTSLTDAPTQTFTEHHPELPPAFQR